MTRPLLMAAMLAALSLYAATGALPPPLPQSSVDAVPMAVQQSAQPSVQPGPGNPSVHSCYFPDPVGTVFAYDLPDGRQLWVMSNCLYSVSYVAYANPVYSNVTGWTLEGQPITNSTPIVVGWVGSWSPPGTALRIVIVSVGGIAVYCATNALESCGFFRGVDNQDGTYSYQCTFDLVNWMDGGLVFGATNNTPKIILTIL